jgi:hypothetical protein
MRSRTLERMLAEIHRREPRMRGGFRSDLESELLQRHGQLYGREATAAAGRRTRRRLRLVVAGLAAGTLIAAVGSIPVTSSVRLGKLVTIRLPAGTGEAPRPAELLRRLRAHLPADKISVSESRSATDEVTLQVFLFGEGIVEDEAEDLLEREFPLIRRGELEVQELRGDIRASLAGRLGRALFLIEVNATDIDNARREILRRFAAHGYGEGSTVELSGDDEGKRIEVQVEQGR